LISISGAILCCGSIVQDIVVRYVDSLVYDTTALVDSVTMSVGGNGANTSYAASILGAPVRLIGCVGTDEFADRVCGALAGGGVEMKWVEHVPGAATATTVVLVNSSAARAFLHNPGVNHFAFEQGIRFSGELVESGSHFHLGNPFAFAELRSRAGTVLADARAAGLTTSVDGGWDATGKWIEVIGPCLPHTDLLFLNQDEARMLSGQKCARDAARFFLDRGTVSVIVKLGARGCVLFDSGAEFAIPPFVVNAVDTTGAGDCFAGAYLAALHHGWSAEQAGRLANAAGALSVGAAGAVTGLLNYEETLRWMDLAETGPAPAI
jgi:ribokinase